MPRNKDGWLKADALRSGVPDQWAKVIGNERHEVSIVHDERQGGFVTQHIILDLATQVREIHTWQVGSNLPLARSFFADVVKSHGG
jgi:hypothetical protein